MRIVLYAQFIVAHRIVSSRRRRNSAKATGLGIVLIYSSPRSVVMVQFGSRSLTAFEMTDYLACHFERIARNFLWLAKRSDQIEALPDQLPLKAVSN